MAPWQPQTGGGRENLPTPYPHTQGFNMFNQRQGASLATRCEPVLADLYALLDRMDCFEYVRPCWVMLYLLAGAGAPTPMAEAILRANNQIATSAPGVPEMSSQLKAIQTGDAQLLDLQSTCKLLPYQNLACP